METKKIVLPEGWEFDKVNGNEIILKKVKEELPKTWEECITTLKECEYINDISNIIETNKAAFDNSKNDRNMLPRNLGKPMLALMQLLVCREVYRQGWKPDWSDEDRKKYYITNVRGKVYSNDGYIVSNTILTFQSAEIRDRFLGNFRDLIEEAKELI